MLLLPEKRHNVPVWQERRFSPPEGIFAFATAGMDVVSCPADGVSVPLRGFLLLLPNGKVTVRLPQDLVATRFQSP